VTLSSGFFNSVDSDRLYTADDFSNYLKGIVTNGCLPNDTGLKVLQGVQGSLGSNPPSVVISIGKAYLNGMWLNNTEPLTFNLGTAPQINPGLSHLVYLKCDTDGDREISIECLTAATPVLPASTSTIVYMALASVIDQQGTQPANAHITDLRPYAGVSGVGITTPSLVDGCVTKLKLADEVRFPQVLESVYLASNLVGTTRDGNGWAATTPLARDIFAFAAHMRTYDHYLLISYSLPILMNEVQAQGNDLVIRNHITAYPTVWATATNPMSGTLDVQNIVGATQYSHKHSFSTQFMMHCTANVTYNLRITHMFPVSSGTNYIQSSTIYGSSTSNTPRAHASIIEFPV
jgi:hypothetical protein